ncbi:putative late blight resistance protein homolog R1A-10 isoform X1 [Salvia hispanica]|uniref:putative late blight resistance protein homolog R1A-10 isoform X1 n=1 Tax=Salvia hispanica TaxID=49212 RepID=UPI00200913FC|nr:putative late blight resistance protein homolog R1A-10 isoform X1 [Salvia hispanica]XP_047955129.1 putative late blight resistance protein homolog R1A-10 isoform X1 [Salvia hispanica]
MTAFGGVLSLRNTIDNILCCSRFSLVDCSRQIIDVVYNELDPLQHILEKLDGTSPSRSRKKVNALDGRIKEAIWRFEDSLESLLIQHIPSQSEILPEIVSIDLQSLQNAANSLIQKLNDMQEEYIDEVVNMPQDEPISSSIGSRGSISKMIGLSDQFKRIKAYLLRGDLPWRLEYSIYGTAGIGKTALAMQIYEDSQIQSKYECRAWVTVGRVPQPISRIARGILAQLCGIAQGDEEISDHYLEERLYGKKCLIVLDDVWEISNFLEDSFLNIKSGCVHILFTGRHRKLLNGILYGTWHEVRFLNEEESMDLLCEKVFGDEICPPHLHKSATKIAKLCEGLPLLILTVADILSKSEHNRDPTYWKDVAEKRNSVFTDAYNEISKVLFPSYEYLPQHLKMPFMFMGVFPQDYHTPPSKIIDMLTAEGLWYDRECLRELAFYYSLVLRNLKSVFKSSHEVSVSDFKACWLHSSWRHVCRGEASKNKFYRVLNKLIDAEEKDLKGQRSLCLENNILFGIKEFRDSVRLNCASSTRSLLLYGPYHQYPISIDVGFMLLREIDALTQRFYTFPIEILSLVQLKYLALTCNGDLPATISKLFNLRVLIMHPHMNIRRCGAPSYVPIQIWDMKELEHIELPGKSLAAPSHVASLKKLSTLVGVNASICTLLELSRRIPSIKKLGIHIELTPYDDHNDLLSCFGCISTLGSLETLKFSITNPVIVHSQVFSVTPKKLRFPRNLKKLHLSGMGLPWEYLDVIGSLPSLKVLKLRSYAFRGSHWKAKRHSFSSLEFLLIEESDLVQWKPAYLSFLRLKYLSLKHCYKLKEIHRPASVYAEFGRMIIEIELEDCNPLALTCASQLQPTNDVRLRVTDSSSFYGKPTTFKCERDGADYISGLERSILETEDENDDEDMTDSEDTDRE